MLQLLGLVISIGLADSLNPSTIGPALYIASGRHARRDVLLFTLGVFGVFFLAGLVVALGPGSAILALVPRPAATTRYILETVAGVAMLVAAALVWWRRHSLARRTSGDSRPKRPGSPLVMGATISIVELPTAFPYLAVIVAVVGSGLDIGRQAVLLAIYNGCFVLPLLAIALTLELAGDRAKQMLARARRFLHDHWPVLLVVLGVLAGVFVTFLGVTGLLSGTSGNVGRISRHLRHAVP